MHTLPSAIAPPVQGLFGKVQLVVQFIFSNLGVTILFLTREINDQRKARAVHDGFDLYSIGEVCLCSLAIP